MGTAGMIIGWILIGVVVIAIFLRVLRNHSTGSRVAVYAFLFGLLGPGVVVPSHFALPVPVIVGFVVHLEDQTPFHLLSWNLTAYLISVSVLLAAGLFLHLRRRRAATSLSQERAIVEL
jgi:hypothetical protein